MRLAGAEDKCVGYALQKDMIICSCSMISAEDVHQAVAALRTKAPYVVLTPGLIYRTLGKRAQCGGCLPLVTKLMVGFDDEGPKSAAALPRRLPLDDTQELD